MERTKYGATRAVEIADPLPPKDRALHNEILEPYQRRRLGTQRHSHKSVARDVKVIADFVAFSGKGPWRWTEQDFDAWCYEIGVSRRLSVATQRHYQGAIKGFLSYLVDNVGLQNRIYFEFGVRAKQIVSSDNSIPHVHDRELSRDRRSLSHEEIETLFKRIDEGIREAKKFRGKDFRPLQRDKALFYTIYALGLRASEALGLDVGSFESNPDLPFFGAFGIARIWGKGSRGSGPKFRAVPVDHVDLPPLLEWYIKAVRPEFLVHADPNEAALFLSERGKRMSLSTLEARFQHVVAIAGLDGRNFTPHSLRHSTVTHGTMTMGTEAMRRKVGHEFSATTQGYTHFPDEYVGDVVQRHVRTQIMQAKGAKS